MVIRLCHKKEVWISYESYGFISGAKITIRIGGTNAISPIAWRQKYKFDSSESKQKAKGRSRRNDQWSYTFLI